jgi:hypothetical protein
LPDGGGQLTDICGYTNIVRTLIHLAKVEDTFVEAVIPARISIVSLLSLVLAPLSAAAQEPVVEDTSYRVQVDAPAYPEGAGPLVLLDEAHHNAHSLTGFYRPFGDLLRADGYRVASLRESITPEALADAGVIVISNALPAASQEAADTLGFAFSDDELEALLGWIRGGGALLLFVDHRPFPRAAANLAALLGLEMLDGYALDYEVWDPVVFSRSRGTLAPHPITNGRDRAERVDSAATFYGHAMRALDPAFRPILVFGPEIESMQPEGLWEIGDDTPRIAVGGWLQGAARSLDRGRVVVYSEAAMAVAQRVGPNAEPRGMNTAVGSQNARLLLNSMRWLTRVLPEH